MLAWIAPLDRSIARTRPAWAWLGQLGLVLLGVHLAADRLDDPLLAWLGALDLPWPTPDTPLRLATWAAVGVELGVDLWAGWTLVRSRSTPVQGPREWAGRASVGALLAALAWPPLAAAGCWVVAMAVEDHTAVALGPGGLWFARAVALLVGWRLGWTGWVRVLRRPPPAARRIEGWVALPPVALVAALALRHGLPLHPWLALLAAVGG